jgi:hypothetical protein
VVWEYKTVYLERDEKPQTWAEEAKGYSRQLTKAAEGGWEITHVQMPWVVFKRPRVEKKAGDTSRGDTAAGNQLT